MADTSLCNDSWYRFYGPRRLATMTRANFEADRAAADADIEALLARMQLHPSDSILEIGCGWGRHSVALAHRGFTKLLSIDIAPDLLARANELAKAENVQCNFRQASFCDVNEGDYAAILSLYDRSCCGFPTEREDLASLRHLATLLKPRGWLLFGINDWPFHLPDPSQAWQEVSDGVELVETIPNRVEMTCTTRTTLIGHDGRRVVNQLTRRHYYLPELRRLLCEAGFELVDARHRLLEDRPYGDGGDGLFVYARRS